MRKMQTKKIIVIIKIKKKTKKKKKIKIKNKIHLNQSKKQIIKVIIYINLQV